MWHSPRGRILLVSFLAYYLVISAGRLGFVRYALPVAALQCSLAAGALVLLYRYRFGVLMAGLALLEPLYNSARVAHLLAAADTRSQARVWVENQLSTGATLGNFGGWAGDVQVETFEHLLGAMALVEDFECSYAILHRHPLGYSNIDSSFAAALGRSGQRLAHFAPADLDASDPAYDRIDAYYVPLGDFGALRQAGPDVEIWRIGPGPAPTPTPRRTLGRAYMSGAFSGATLWACIINRPLEGEEALLGCWAAFSEGFAHSINVGLKRNTRHRIYRARFSAVPERAGSLVYNPLDTIKTLDIPRLYVLYTCKELQSFISFSMRLINAEKTYDYNR